MVWEWRLEGHHFQVFSTRFRLLSKTEFYRVRGSKLLFDQRTSYQRDFLRWLLGWGRNSRKIAFMSWANGHPFNTGAHHCGKFRADTTCLYWMPSWQGPLAITTETNVFFHAVPKNYHHEYQPLSIFFSSWGIGSPSVISVKGTAWRLPIQASSFVDSRFATSPLSPFYFSLFRPIIGVQSKVTMCYIILDC